METHAARVLVVDQDRAKVSVLKQELEEAGYQVQIAEVGDEIMPDQVAVVARSFWPHLIVVDQGPIDADNFSSKLLDILRPGHCILYTAEKNLTSQVTREISKRYPNTVWVSKDESDSRRVLRGEIEKMSRENCACRRRLTCHWPPAWNPQLIAGALLGESVNVPADAIEDILGQLFPESKDTLTLKTMGGEVPVSLTLSQGGSFVLRVLPDEDREPAIVRLALAEQIRGEMQNYQQVRRGLGGPICASIEKSIEFGGMGGTRYAFNGPYLPALPSFAVFYRGKTDPQIILKPLSHHLDVVWKPHFRRRLPGKNLSLFQIYDQALQLQKRLDKSKVSRFTDSDAEGG